MSDKGKVVRLSKAAREFNIGLDTVVEFLSDNGLDIVKNPNTKLSPEMYAMLQQEFQDEKELKEAAKERNLEFLRQGPISIKSSETTKEKEVEEEIEIPDELLIKNVGIEEKADIKHEETIETEKEEIVEEVIEVVEEITEEIAEEKPEPKKTEEVVEETTPKQVVEEEVVEEKIVEAEPEIAEAKEEVVAETIEEVAEIKEEIVETKEETPVVKEEFTEKETPEAEKTEEQKPVEKVAEQDSENEKGEVKVLGKIDLESMNLKTRPTRKSKEEKKKEADAKRKEKVDFKAKAKEENTTKERPKQKPKQQHQKNKPERRKEEHKPIVVEVGSKLPGEDRVEKKKVEEEHKKDDNFIPTKHQKLTGPTVLGKIELPSKPVKKKKPVASSSDEPGGNKNKRKRKRIKNTDNKAKVGNENTHKQNQNKKFSKKPKKNTRPARVEPTEEDIQKKIKETLNRLAPSGKSKSSKYRRQKRDHVSEHIREENERSQQEKEILKVTEFLTANELANMMDIGVTDIIKTCMQVGLFVSINQRLDAETISLVTDEYGFKTEFVGIDDHDKFEVKEVEDKPEDLVDRAPIVTVMGHVDHGKTKLLDYIRKANVVAGEAGGITQHIGAYEVTTESGKVITFLDTPGHEAFTAMRARGAKVTDIAIIVIAADDSVMPQTKEAINHAQAAGVPIVFAFNKMDKPGASSDRIKEQLSQMNILVEEWGGKFQSQEISALKGEGVNDLLDKVLLEAEMLELKANPNKPGKGTVIEASLDKGRGYISTVLVQEGTMKKGDIVIAGPVYGKVKAMFDERNKPKDVAGPSVPVVILGLNDAPQAGDVFNVMEDEKEAKNIVSKRQQLIREQSLRTQKHITLDEIGRRIAIGDFKEMNLIVKGDVDGSVEALSDELLKLTTKEVQVNVIHKAVGAITESDIMLASASDAIIIGFQVRPVPQARKLAENEQIDIRLYSIIYQATEEIKAAIVGMLAPKTEEKIVCNIEVRETFKITKVGTIAGCYVLDGKVNRKTTIRLIRDGIVVYTGLLGSLKRFKDDVKEVSAGYECGLNIERFNDIKVGDIIEGYEEVEVAR